MKIFGSKDIKLYIEELLYKKKDELKNRIVIDIPAGNGHSTQILKDIGSFVEPYDLFPEFFNVDGLRCQTADLCGTLPIQSHYADFVLCQEGIEHLSDQVLMFKEFNRILKKGGRLLLTTPSYSIFRSKISYLLSESEYYYKIMPPNEIDSIWFSNNDTGNDIYYGHIFMIGIQKLRVISKISGFRIKKVHHFKINHSSLLLFPFLYPLIFIANCIGYIRAMNKKKDIDKTRKKDVYGEIFRLSIDPRILLDGHIIVEFEKEYELSEVRSTLKGKYSGFSIT